MFGAIRANRLIAPLFDKKGRVAEICNLCGYDGGDLTGHLLDFCPEMLQERDAMAAVTFGAPLSSFLNRDDAVTVKAIADFGDAARGKVEEKSAAERGSAETSKEPGQ